MGRMQDGFVSFIGEIQKWHCHASTIWLHSKTSWNSFQLANQDSSNDKPSAQKRNSKKLKGQNDTKDTETTKMQKGSREKNNAQSQQIMFVLVELHSCHDLMACVCRSFLSLLCIERLCQQKKRHTAFHKST